MQPVYTIGYEGTDIDRFIKTLKAVGVKQVADVRAVALSRKKGFSKTALRERLAQEGIDYVHFMSLGDPKPGREAARAGKYDQFRKIYYFHLASEGAQNSMKELRKAVAETATCLLCFERDPNVCHRSIVTQELAKSGVQTFDLYGDDPSRYIRNKTILTSRHPRQGAAAA